VHGFFVVEGWIMRIVLFVICFGDVLFLDVGWVIVVVLEWFGYEVIFFDW